MKKKMMAVLLIGIMILSLSACGASKGSNDSSTVSEGSAGTSEEDASVDSASESEEVTAFKSEVTNLLDKTLSIEDGEAVAHVEDLYSNLSEDDKASLGEEWVTKVGLLRTRLESAVLNTFSSNVVAEMEQQNLYKAHEGIKSLKDYANEDMTELLCRADEVIQFACYPKTLIQKVPYVTAYKSGPLTTLVEETDEYAIYSYVYNSDASKDKSKLDGNGYDDGFCQYIESAFTTTPATDDERAYAQKLKENLPDGVAQGTSYSVWLQETGDFISYGKQSGTMEHTINDVTVGGDSQYRRYESMSVLIIYGDYEVDYMPEPKVSAFANKDESQEETEEATEEETEEKTIADFKSDHEATESARPSTSGEENALQRAKEYIEVIAFSYNGLVEQLKYEGFSQSESEFGATNCGANWDEQAAKKAKQYLEIFAFSKEQLIDQLVYDGFTQSQAEYGVGEAY